MPLVLVTTLPPSLSSCLLIILINTVDCTAMASNLQACAKTPQCTNSVFVFFRKDMRIFFSHESISALLLIFIEFQ
jgi:hypothetical protein